MAQSSWIGLGALLLLIGFVVLALRGGLGIRPDPDRKANDWTNITSSGSEGGGSGSASSGGSD
jgi:hypothetical protein